MHSVLSNVAHAYDSCPRKMPPGRRSLPPALEKACVKVEQFMYSPTAYAILMKLI